MENKIKEIKITVPEGYEIDKEKSTFEKIVFKKIGEKPWRYNETKNIDGYWISGSSNIMSVNSRPNKPQYYDVFATEKQAKSALAMAQISQIMANDERFGGVVTDEEWKTSDNHKYTIYRVRNNTMTGKTISQYHFLAFHTLEQCTLFLEENEDLVKDYLMI